MADSTTDDMTASTVEDVIAEALAAPCPHDEASMALAFEWCPDCSADREGHYGRVAAAVVAAIRGMSVEQQAELIGGQVERADLKRLAADGRFAWVPCSRVVTEWRAEP